MRVARLRAATLRDEAWARGYFEVFEEHLYTESMQIVLRNAISTIPRTGNLPRVLLTTFPNESHGLGLLMAECMMVLQGARCLSLGTQTPLRDIADAAQVHQVDVVALSFSVQLSNRAVLDGLLALRGMLPASIEIWAGGASRALRQCRSMLAKVCAVAVQGIDAYPVEVEVNIGWGIRTSQCWDSSWQNRSGHCRSNRRRACMRVRCPLRLPRHPPTGAGP